MPDGDTGTNMHLTLESVGNELAKLEDPGDMAATCKAISHGSLMGARGNSGVILCQILRGLAKTFRRKREMPAVAWALPTSRGVCRKPTSPPAAV